MSPICQYVNWKIHNKTYEANILLITRMRSILNLLMNLNYASNFFIYTIRLQQVNKVN